MTRYRSPGARRSLGNTASLAFASIPGGPASLTRPAGRLSNDAAGSASCYRPHRRSPRRGPWTLGSGTGRFPRHRQPATGPPGSYPGRTSTGRRRRAYEHKETPWPYISRCHLLFCWAREKPQSVLRPGPKPGPGVIQAQRRLFGFRACLLNPLAPPAGSATGGLAAYCFPPDYLPQAGECDDASDPAVADNDGR